MFRTSRRIISQIDNYLAHVKESSSIFKIAMYDFLKHNDTLFQEHLNKMAGTEYRADLLKREIENTLYTHALLPESRGDVLRLIERLDELINTAKEIMVNFDIEKPFIPENFHPLFFDLVDTSALSVEMTVEAANKYFNKPYDIKDSLNKIYLLEKQADTISNQLKHQIFSTDSLNLSEKMHIRYFVARTDLLADTAESVADILSVSAIKLIV